MIKALYNTLGTKAYTAWIPGVDDGTKARAIITGATFAQVLKDTSAIDNGDFAAWMIELDLAGMEPGAMETEKRTFLRCDFSYADFTDSAFLDCRFIHCTFKDAKFVNSQILNCAFENVEFGTADFDSANLTGCSFSACNLDNTNFYNSAPSYKIMQRGLQATFTAIQETRDAFVVFRNCLNPIDIASFLVTGGYNDQKAKNCIHRIATRSRPLSEHFDDANAYLDQLENRAFKALMVK